MFVKNQTSRVITDTELESESEPEIRVKTEDEEVGIHGTVM